MKRLILAAAVAASTLASAKAMSGHWWAHWDSNNHYCEFFVEGEGTPDSCPHGGSCTTQSTIAVLD